MNQETPIQTIEKLLAARSIKDFDTAFDCYHRDAIIVFEPGKTANGTENIMAFIQQASVLPLTFKGHLIVESGDTALHLSDYQLDLGEQGIINGKTADVLKRQSDGRWLLIIDNAWAGNNITA